MERSDGDGVQAAAPGGRLVPGCLLRTDVRGDGLGQVRPGWFWTGAFERWGYPVGLRWLVGVIEVAGGILLLLCRGSLPTLHWPSAR